MQSKQTLRDNNVCHLFLSLWHKSNCFLQCAEFLTVQGWNGEEYASNWTLCVTNRWWVYWWFSAASCSTEWEKIQQMHIKCDVTSMHHGKDYFITKWEKENHLEINDSPLQSLSMIGWHEPNFQHLHTTCAKWCKWYFWCPN